MSNGVEQRGRSLFIATIVMTVAAFAAAFAVRGVKGEGRLVEEGQACGHGCL